jgi:ABC-2 type transport system ATP-binding protein
MKRRLMVAKAMVHHPPVLILDEPTAGLDPTQIRSTRGLIRELGQQHTILLSTHILSEVEATCDNVILIHRGKVALSCSLSDLKARASARAQLLMVVMGQGNANAFRNVEGVDDLSIRDLEPGGAVELRITTRALTELAPRLCQFAAQNEWRVQELRVERPTLEDEFVRITEEQEVAAL